jgi:hypothetical protein
MRYFTLRRRTMKKTILVTLLILAVSAMMLHPGQVGRKRLNYHQVENFMSDYYRHYNLYTQDPWTIDLMDKYWAPEFIAISYLPIPGNLVLDLASWKNFLVGVHMNLRETLTVVELSIDTRRFTVVSRLVIEFHDRTTGALALQIEGTAFYNLKVERRNRLKMTALKLYVSDPEALMAISGPPPGM